LAAERLAHRFGVPFILEIRDLWPQSLVDYGRMSAGHPAIRILAAIEGHLYRRASSIVTVLPNSFDYLESRGAVRDKIYWLPNGSDLSAQSPVQPLPENDPFTIVFAGIHGVANGLHQVLEAADILQKSGDGDKVKFLFVGDGGQKPALVETARSKNLKNVEFREPVPKSEVSRILAESDAGLMILKSVPTFRWGISPNKLFDYLAAGRPVLYSVNSANDPVSEAKAGISVKPDDPKSLAEGALKLASLPKEERQAMGERGRRYVEENHDLNRLAEKLELAVQEGAMRKAGSKS
jgi:glycosyltransferase involved in cell wall biosynthesis